MRSKRRSKPSKKIYNTWVQGSAFSHHFLLTVCVLIIATALPGCTALLKQAPEDRETEMAGRELLSRLAATNQNLRHFKGIGRIQLAAANTAAIDERVVWAASAPTKLSVAVLASGIPVLKFASDGQHLYLVDMRDARNSFHKIRSTDPQLDRLISIPVRSSDIVLMLAGRLPVRRHGRVRLTTADSGQRLLILERWWQVVQKIHVDPQRDEVQMVELFDGRGQLAYRVTFEDRLEVAAYRIPRIIRFVAGSDAWLRLRIDRLYPDAEIKPEVFILKPPNRDTSAVRQQ